MGPLFKVSIGLPPIHYHQMLYVFIVTNYIAPDNKKNKNDRGYSLIAAGILIAGLIFSPVFIRC